MSVLLFLLTLTAIVYGTVHTLKLPFHHCLVMFLSFLVGVQASLYFQALRQQIGAGAGPLATRRRNGTRR